MPLKEGTRNELEPVSAVLSSEGVALWADFADRVEVQLATNGLFEPIRGLANKLPEHAVRLSYRNRTVH